MDDELWQHESIPEGRRALDLFTDRHETIGEICHYLNEDPARRQILFLHGASGNGKSLLLRVLRDRYCKRLRPDNWSYVKTIPESDFATNLERAAEDRKSVV